MRNTAENSYYDSSFYNSKRASALVSARTTLGELKKLYLFDSVADIGCGDCIWGVACEEIGISGYVGIDGEYAKAHVPAGFRKKFISHDLEKSELVFLEGKYDLVISLEVAEHLSKDCAPDFVRRLALIGDVVMFSAAIPGQGGSNHLNEQWQSYWSKLFLDHGFVPFDIVRPLIWNRNEVAEYYRQNILIYCSQSREDLINHFGSCVLNIGPVFDIVHPRTYRRLLDVSRIPLRDYLVAFPKILRRVVLNRMKSG